MKKPSQKELQRRRREFRKGMTVAEDLLWSYLRNKRLNDKKFRRQHPIGSYIVDFYCFSENLVIELDGNHHFDDQQIIEYDRQRTDYLSKLGLKVIRFENQLVLDHPEFVLNQIRKVFKD